jgi:hypothetical protein
MAAISVQRPELQELCDSRRTIGIRLVQCDLNSMNLSRSRCAIHNISIDSVLTLAVLSCWEEPTSKKRNENWNTDDVCG